VFARVETLAKAAAAEAAAAAAEVAAMPGGPHENLDRARQAVARRALALLSQLREPAEREAPNLTTLDLTATSRATMHADALPRSI
jgi:hypothetical protein